MVIILPSQKIRDAPLNNLTFIAHPWMKLIWMPVLGPRKMCQSITYALSTLCSQTLHLIPTEKNISAGCASLAEQGVFWPPESLHAFLTWDPTQQFDRFGGWLFEQGAGVEGQHQNNNWPGRWIFIFFAYSPFCTYKYLPSRPSNSNVGQSISHPSPHRLRSLPLYRICIFRSSCMRSDSRIYSRAVNSKDIALSLQAPHSLALWILRSLNSITLAVAIWQVPQTWSSFFWFLSCFAWEK